MVVNPVLLLPCVSSALWFCLPPISDNMNDLNHYALKDEGAWKPYGDPISLRHFQFSISGLILLVHLTYFFDLPCKFGFLFGKLVQREVPVSVEVVLSFQETQAYD
ncbi:hypothetical protein J6590_027746 [Homalodisca vitripennis]|nr:hypothetical protein J6590_027746 [Homalodisca vitripennis]